jgi:hypothetical protein
MGNSQGHAHHRRSASQQQPTRSKWSILSSKMQEEGLVVTTPTSALQSEMTCRFEYQSNSRVDSTLPKQKKLQQKQGHQVKKQMQMQSCENDAQESESNKSLSHLHDQIQKLNDTLSEASHHISKQMNMNMLSIVDQGNSSLSTTANFESIFSDTDKHALLMMIDAQQNAGQSSSADNQINKYALMSKVKDLMKKPGCNDIQTAKTDEDSERMSAALDNKDDEGSLSSQGFSSWEHEQLHLLTSKFKSECNKENIQNNSVNAYNEQKVSNFASQANAVVTTFYKNGIITSSTSNSNKQDDDVSLMNATNDLVTSGGNHCSSDYDSELNVLTPRSDIDNIRAQLIPAYTYASRVKQYYNLTRDVIDLNEQEYDPSNAHLSSYPSSASTLSRMRTSSSSGSIVRGNGQHHRHHHHHRSLSKLHKSKDDDNDVKVNDMNDFIQVNNDNDEVKDHETYCIDKDDDDDDVDDDDVDRSFKSQINLLRPMQGTQQSCAQNNKQNAISKISCHLCKTQIGQFINAAKNNDVHILKMMIDNARQVTYNHRKHILTRTVDENVLNMGEDTLPRQLDCAVMLYHMYLFRLLTSRDDMGLNALMHACSSTVKEHQDNAFNVVHYLLESMGCYNHKHPNSNAFKSMIGNAFNIHRGCVFSSFHINNTTSPLFHTRCSDAAATSLLHVNASSSSNEDPTMSLPSTSSLSSSSSSSSSCTTSSPITSTPTLNTSKKEVFAAESLQLISATLQTEFWYPCMLNNCYCSVNAQNCYGKSALSMGKRKIGFPIIPFTNCESACRHADVHADVMLMFMLMLMSSCSCALYVEWSEQQLQVQVNICMFSCFFATYLFNYDHFDYIYTHVCVLYAYCLTCKYI